MTLELHATPEEVMRAVEALQAYARSRQVPEKIIFGLALALEECGSNIVNHALQRDARLRFRVTIECANDELSIELRDGGPKFDPTAQADCRLRTDEEAHGGWGIQLVRRYTDEIRYQHEAGENILRLGKRLLPAAGAAKFLETHTQIKTKT